MIDPELVVIGIPWCRQEDYSAYVALFEDPHKLPAAWHDFIAAREESERIHKKSFTNVRRINIDPPEFAGWCNARGYRINTDSAQKFASERAVEEHREARR